MSGTHHGEMMGYHVGVMHISMGRVVVVSLENVVMSVTAVIQMMGVLVGKMM
jgi:hypothetical protein